MDVKTTYVLYFLLPVSGFVKTNRVRPQLLKCVLIKPGRFLQTPGNGLAFRNIQRPALRAKILI